MEDKNMAKAKLVKTNEKIAENVVGGYKKIENNVVCAYKKVDKFVDQYLTKECESIGDAKARIKSKKSERDEARKAEQTKRAANQQEMIQASKERSDI
jgi:hypothetical protein